LSIEGKLYQLEGLHPTSIDNNFTSIDHYNHHQTFSESESDTIYCKTDDDDDDDDGVDNDADYVVDRYIDPRIIPH